MMFVSFRELVEDVRQWSTRLPADLIAVAGIPRSGLIPAALLALHRNIHLVDIQDLKTRAEPWRDRLRRGVEARHAGKVLVLDDAVRSGETLRMWREKIGIGDNLVYGAVYYSTETDSAGLDCCYRHVRTPRCFEWNWVHCKQLEYMCLDLDGVVCEDWKGREEEAGLGREKYLEHVNHAQPKHLPTTYPVFAIVTSRLEKYRSQTESWLYDRGVEVKHLVMSPHSSVAERRHAADAAARKADFYCRHPHLRLFVESDPKTAQTIARIANRPVLCTETMGMFYPSDGRKR